MQDLLRYELFKLQKSKPFWIVIIIAAGYTLLSALIFVAISWVLTSGMLDGIAPEAGDLIALSPNGLSSAAASTLEYSILVMAITCSILLTEQQLGITRNMVMSGKPRYMIFTSKTIIILSIAVTIFTIATLLHSAVHAIAFGAIDISAAAFTGRFFLALLQFLALTAIIIFFARLTKNTGATIGIIIGLGVLFQMLYLFIEFGNEGILVNIMTVVTQLYAANLVAFTVAPDANLLQFALTAVATLIIFLGAGLLLFQKEELK